MRGLLVVLAFVISGQSAASNTSATSDESKIIYVTNDPNGADFGPQFSPDCQRLIFDRRPLISGRWETYEVPIKGGVPKPFISTQLPVAQTRLHWSLTVNKIVFTGIAPHGAASTWLMNGDGTHAHPAYGSSSVNVYYPTWYADGNRIVELDSDKSALRIVNLDTGKAEQLTTTPALLTGMASVSPDGKWIAVAAQMDVGQSYDQTVNKIWLISDKGIAHPLEKNNMEGRAPSWSPDGSKLLFESNQGSPRPTLYAIFVADKDGTNVQQLTPFELNAQHPTWSSDGKWIAFSARQAKVLGAFGPGIAIMAAPTLARP
jgi:Tol biopolymer transport system component